MSDTPRCNSMEWSWTQLVYEARQIERELNDAKQHIEELKRAGNELAAWVESIYKMNHFLSLEQYKQIKRDLKDWEKANQ